MSYDISRYIQIRVSSGTGYELRYARDKTFIRYNSFIQSRLMWTTYIDVVLIMHSINFGYNMKCTTIGISKKLSPELVW